MISAPHGVRGELRLRLDTDFPERVARRRSLSLRLGDGSERRYRVRAVRPHQGMLLVRLVGVEDRTAAEELRGALVIIPFSEAAPLPEGRYYEHQILGLRVVTPDGQELGRVTGILQAASNDVYVAGRYMIPATRDAVVRIAPEEGLLVVRSREYLEGEEVR